MKTMRPLAYAGFVLLVALGLNCAITDYGLITDNNQFDGKGGADGKYGPRAVIDTQGKAHIYESSAIATIWPDGTDELINFIDQKADGTAVLTTYNNFSSGSEPTFHSDMYCDTARQGCSIFTAPDNNDENLFDGVLNEHCSGARSLGLLLSTGRYYGECGKLSGRGDRVSLRAKNTIFNSAIFANRWGREGLLYPVHGGSVDIRLRNDLGTTYSVPMRGAGELWVSADDNWAALDVRDPLVGRTLTWYAEFLDRYATERTTVTVTYAGISVDFRIAGRHPTISADRILDLRERAY